MIRVSVLAAMLGLLVSGCSQVEPAKPSILVATVEAGPQSATEIEAAQPATDRPETEVSSVAAAPRIEVGDLPGDDLDDVVLIYNSSRTGNFDSYFCLIAEFYGLECRRIDLAANELRAGDLLDENGETLGLIGISARTLLESGPLLSGDEVTVLRSAVEQGGANLFVAKIKPNMASWILERLTRGAIVGTFKPEDSHREWSVSSLAPEYTLEFTGLTISPDTLAPQNDFGIQLGDEGEVISLILSADDSGASYPVFVMSLNGAGSVFVDAGMGLDKVDTSLRRMYYTDQTFSRIIPLMMAFRYTVGDEAWHNTHNYANLTLDAPPLRSRLYGVWEHLDYSALLYQMIRNDFHTTVAFEPENWSESETDVIGLFVAHPDRYSLVQYGNNNDGYEFYRYKFSDGAAGENPARPLVDQEQDIVEGELRMELHQALTGISYDKIMIFPWGISPEPTLELLKERNYLAVVQGQPVPLDAPPPSQWDSLMELANVEYANFPLLRRRAVRAPDEFDPLYPAYEMFLHKPVLLYSSVSPLLESGVNGLRWVTDIINSFDSQTEWRSLGYIVRHLYLEKVNDDDSIDVKMYGNHLIVENETEEDRTYHLYKEETLNVPIVSLTVNGREFPFEVEDGMLRLDAWLPAAASMEVVITYGN